jgi:hypothetical protein
MRPLPATLLALLVLTGTAIPATEWLRSPPWYEDGGRRELRDFLLALAPLTRYGETIALVVPEEYREADTIAYWAGYLLPGRHLVLGPAKADGIAIWRMPQPPLTRKRAVSVGGGVLVR